VDIILNNNRSNKSKNIGGKGPFDLYSGFEDQNENNELEDRKFLEMVTSKIF
jgi:hypothetical protein